MWTKPEMAKAVLAGAALSLAACHAPESPAAGMASYPESEAAQATAGVQEKPQGTWLMVRSASVNEAFDQRGEEIRFKFQLAPGQVAPAWALQHGKVAHLIVVSEDGQSFQHLHPELNPQGLAITVPWEKSGRHILFLETQLKGESRRLDRFETKVEAVESSPAIAFGQGSAYNRIRKSGIQASLQVGELRVREKSELRLSLSHGTGEPVTDVRTYLEAPAHFVAISEDFKDFVHLHPQSRVDSMGKNAGYGPHFWSQAVFPRAGKYRLWAEFKREAGMEVFRYPLEVAEADSSGTQEDSNRPLTGETTYPHPGGHHDHHE